jgi:DNA-binding CsgD family transcriptional regulator
MIDRKRAINVLTERQREVLALVRRGRSNREIGSELSITEDGVKAHLSRLYLRFGVTNRVELLNAADETADNSLSDRAPLGTLRAIAGRADVHSDKLEADAARPVGRQLVKARQALAAVDVALDLVRDLPAETTGPVIDAVRRRLAMALAAIEVVEKEVDSPRTA